MIDGDTSIAALDPTQEAFALQSGNVFYTASGHVFMGWKAYSALKEDLTVVTNPLFCPTRKFLIDRLRLEKLPEDNSAQDLIDAAIDDVKTGFYRRLSSSRISLLQSYAYTRNIGSEAGALRLLAISTEVKWVRLELMRTMPMSFVDGLSTLEQWQEEAAFRQATAGQLISEIRKIRQEIDLNMETLEGHLQPGEDGRFQISPIGPDEVPPLPHDSARTGIQGGIL